MLKTKLLERKNLILIIFIAFFLISAFFIFYKFFINQKIDLKREANGNINILLLGRGGGRHEGPDLTDTMMVAALNPEKNTVNLISIPRDLWIPDLSSKINSAYSTGQEKGKQGKLLAKTVVEKVTGSQIDYVLVIDFSGFAKLVDHLGGIDVEVKQTLDDFEYPIAGKEDDPCDLTEEAIIDLSAQIATGSAKELEAFPCRYKHIRFDKGVIHMNGEQALEFVRSRHGQNGEGTDFARSQRQQDVINAIKIKTLSLGIILNPIKVLGAFNIVKENIDTDIKINEIDDFINLAKRMQKANITSTVIDFGDDKKERFGLLIHPPVTSEQKFQWVLLPRIGNGDFSEIHEYIACIKEGLACSVEDEGIKKEKVN